MKDSPDRPAVLTSRPTRLRLPEVTLVCVDTAYPEASRLALRRTLERCEMGEALFFTHAAIQEPGVRTVPIAPLQGTDAYSRFLVKELVRHIDTEFVLVIQWDGFVSNADCWSDEFLQYDYVGARWVHHDDGLVVGNGGFSLRSRRLLTALQDSADLRHRGGGRCHLPHLPPAAGARPRHRLRPAGCGRPLRL